MTRRFPPPGPRRDAASILLMTLVVMVLLSAILGTTLLVAANRYHAAWQAGSWQEALGGAEAGADLAVAALNTGNWSGWNSVPGPPPLSGSPAGGSPASGPPKADNYLWKTIELTHPGEGNQRLALAVTLDAPASLARAPGGPWMRVRAAGTADVPGPPRPSMERLDAALRKLSLVTDRHTGQAVIVPQVSRRIEVIVKPSPHRRAITLQNCIVMTGGVIDSFDSSDPLRSLGQLFDPSRHGTQGNVATLRSDGSDLNNVTVYGNLDFNGPDVPNVTGVRGSITPHFAEELPVVTDPGPGWTVTHPEVTAVNNLAVLVGGPKAAPARYKLTDFNVSLGAVTIAPGVAGQESYVEIWVTGDLRTAGLGTVVQLPGVHTTYFVDGDISIVGGSFVNRSNVAANMTLKGVTPTDGGSRQVNVLGNGNFIGVIEAPAYDFKVGGSGDFSGALIGNTIRMSQNAGVHYDEALNRQGTNYTAVSWYEDTR